MRSIDFDRFSPELQQGFTKLLSRLEQRILRYHEQGEEAQAMLAAINPFYTSFHRGKKAFFKDLRSVFQSLVVTKGISGLREYVAVDFNNIFVNLPIAERFWIKEDRRLFRRFNYREKEMSSMLEDINAHFCRTLDDLQLSFEIEQTTQGDFAYRFKKYQAPFMRLTGEQDYVELKVLNGQNDPLVKTLVNYLLAEMNSKVDQRAE